MTPAWPCLCGESELSCAKLSRAASICQHCPRLHFPKWVTELWVWKMFLWSELVNSSVYWTFCSASPVQCVIQSLFTVGWVFFLDCSEIVAELLVTEISVQAMFLWSQGRELHTINEEIRIYAGLSKRKVFLQRLWNSCCNKSAKWCETGSQK